MNRVITGCLQGVALVAYGILIAHLSLWMWLPCALVGAVVICLLGSD